MMRPAFSSIQTAAVFAFLLLALLVSPMFINANTGSEMTALQGEVVSDPVFALRESAVIYFKALVRMPLQLLEWFHPSKRAVQFKKAPEGGIYLRVRVAQASCLLGSASRARELLCCRHWGNTFVGARTPQPTGETPVLLQINRLCRLPSYA